jgi:hypothetical protein
MGILTQNTTSEEIYGYLYGTSSQAVSSSYSTTASFALKAGTVVGTPLFNANTGILDMNEATFVGYSQFQQFPVTNIIGTNTVGYIGAFGFTSCNSLISASFPSVTQIGTNTFQNDPVLQYVDFPLLTSIGFQAFRNTPLLSNAIFPSVITCAGGDAFHSSGIVSASFPVCTFLDEQSFESCPNLSYTEFPLVQSIGQFCFNDNTSLTKATFPSATTIAGANAFTNTRFTALSQSIIPLVTVLPANTFANNISASSAVFENVVTVGATAFSGCTNVTTVNFPSATSLGATAFGRVPIVATNGSFPNVVTAGATCFSGSSTLQTASMAKLETLGGAGVFSSVALRKVELPAITASNQIVNITNVNLPNIREVLLDGVKNAIVANTNLIGGRTTLATASFASASGVAASQFSGCTSLGSINIPRITGTTGLGGSVANNNVFLNTPVSGTLTIPTFYATCQTGSLPDSDVQYLIGRGWTINYI